jgi:pimeloyl-ACP methyl ester carboxylesterase
MKAEFFKSTILKVFILIVVLAAGSYFYSVGKKKVLSNDDRKSVSGKFIKLSQGVVHYEVTGPKTGQTVVMIHGLATPYYIWDNNIDELINAGFRVVRYDHYGRGFSERPDVVYDINLYDQLLFELLKKLEVKMPVHLVGLSMGGAVAVTFTDRHPEMVSKVGLIAPAGFPIKIPFTVKLAKAPLLGDYIMAVLGDAVLLSEIKGAFAEPEKLSEFEEKFKVQMQYRGFKRALLSTLRNMDMHSLSETYKRVGKQKKPVLLIWGRKDHVLPFTNSEKVKEAIPHLKFHAIQGAGHNLNYENPEIVNPLLVRFLRQSG